MGVLRCGAKHSSDPRVGEAEGRGRSLAVAVVQLWGLAPVPQPTSKVSPQVSDYGMECKSTCRPAPSSKQENTAAAASTPSRLLTQRLVQYGVAQNQAGTRMLEHTSTVAKVTKYKSATVGRKI